jgi:hypothetical protein
MSTTNRTPAERLHVLQNAAGDMIAFQGSETLTVASIPKGGVATFQSLQPADAREEWRKAIASGYVWTHTVFASHTVLSDEEEQDRAARRPLCCGDKVTGLYHGIPFAGVLESSDGSREGFMVRLPAGNEIVAYGSKRDGLWIVVGSDEHNSLRRAA